MAFLVAWVLGLIKDEHEGCGVGEEAELLQSRTSLRVWRREDGGARSEYSVPVPGRALGSTAMRTEGCSGKMHLWNPQCPGPRHVSETTVP